jgi:hypothetical protein
MRLPPATTRSVRPASPVERTCPWLSPAAAAGIGCQWSRWGRPSASAFAVATTASADEGSALPVTHDYVRHGTTTLFAALEVATGRTSVDACYDRHRIDEFLAFLKQVAKAHPRVQLHLVVDDYATHHHPRVRAWLARHP